MKYIYVSHTEKLFSYHNRTEGLISQLGENSRVFPTHKFAGVIYRRERDFSPNWINQSSMYFRTYEENGTLEKKEKDT